MTKLGFAPLCRVLSFFWLLSKIIRRSAAGSKSLPVPGILDEGRKIGKSQAWWQGDSGTQKGRAAGKSMRQVAGTHPEAGALGFSGGAVSGLPWPRHDGQALTVTAV
jgi:hypothetical protein